MSEWTDLPTRLARLLKNATKSGDMQFVLRDSNEVRISAHKIIVELASPELYTMIHGSLDIPGAQIDSANQVTLNVDGISAESFMEVLNYIYTDMANINESNALEIMLKANYYGLNFLQEDCIEYLTNQLNYFNCLQLYNFVYNTFFGYTGFLKNISILIRYRPQATAFNNSLWFDLNADTVCSILSLPTMNCDEIERFCALLAWVKNNPDNLRPSLFDCIKIQAITLQQFDQSIECYGLRDIHTITEMRQRCIGDRNASRHYFTYQGAPWKKVSLLEIIPSLSERNDMGLYLREGKDFMHPCRTHSQGEVFCWPKDIIRFSEYWSMERIGENFDVLSGDGYEFVTVHEGDDIPHNAVLMKNASIDFDDYYPEFVGFANNNFGIIDWSNYKLTKIRHQDPLPFPIKVLVAQDMTVYNERSENIPPDAFCINNTEPESHPLYLGHVRHSSGDILPAIIDHQARTATATYGYQNVVCNEYKFNRHVKKNVCWVPANPFPSLNEDAEHYPIVCGRTHNGEILFFGRAYVNSKLEYGKIHLSCNAFFFAGNEGEVAVFANYEVLVHNKIS